MGHRFHARRALARTRGALAVDPHESVVVGGYVGQTCGPRMVAGQTATYTLTP